MPAVLPPRQRHRLTQRRTVRDRISVRTTPSCSPSLHGKGLGLLPVVLNGAPDRPGCSSAAESAVLARTAAVRAPHSWLFCPAVPTVLVALLVSTTSVSAEGTGMGQSSTAAAVSNRPEGMIVRGVNETGVACVDVLSEASRSASPPPNRECGLSRFVAQTCRPMARRVVPDRPCGTPPDAVELPVTS